MIPTTVELDIIYHRAFHASKRSENATWSLDAIDAVRDAVLDGLTPPDGVGSIHVMLFANGWETTMLHDDNRPETVGQGQSLAASLIDAFDKAGTP